mmetsp:Transcript_27886/g.65535  ORF Transcript_27886/g.65535 Transcript_27886/m.65535 type:complete len:80 (-) Transcript_27886:758-997(-)
MELSNFGVDVNQWLNGSIHEIPPQTCVNFAIDWLSFILPCGNSGNSSPVQHNLMELFNMVAQLFMELWSVAGRYPWEAF